MPQSRSARSSNLTALLALVIIAQLGYGAFAISAGSLLRGQALVTLLAMAAGTILLTIRSKFRTGAKALLILAICAMLLLVFARQDISGLRAVEADLDAGLAETGSEAPERAVRDANRWTPGSEAVRIDLVQTGGDPRFAHDLAAEVRGRAFDRSTSGIRVTGRIRMLSLRGKPAYQLSWSIAVGEELRWCGVVSAVGQSYQDALASFASAIEAAIRASGESRASCF